MNNAAKVIWKEGMFLQPQHFQQFERHIFSVVNARFAAEQPYAHGLLELSLDADAIANGMVALRACRGVLPDGTVVDVPGQDGAPEARSIAAHLPAERQHLDVYCALAREVEGRANVVAGQGPAEGPVRYGAVDAQVQDTALGRGTKEIELGRLNLQIRFGDESLDGYSALRVARLARTPNGEVRIDESHIPPLLRIGASRSLGERLRGLLELLLARAAGLGHGRRHTGGGLAAFAAGEETAFRLYQAINTYVPLVMHHERTENAHPLDLFALLSSLGGALCTFSSEIGVADLPRYDHDDLTGTFDRLFTCIRRVLGTDLATRCVPIPVEQVGPALFVCRVPDARLFTEAKFYLGISAARPEKEIVVGALQRIKMSSRERLDVLIASALPGLQLMHAPRPPEGLATKPSFAYFSLSQQGALWEGIRASGSLAFHFPSDLPNLALEMMALRA